MGVISDTMRNMDGEWIYRKRETIINQVADAKIVWDKLNQMITYYQGEGDTDSVDELTAIRSQMTNLMANLASYCS